jgi:transposase
MLVVSAVQPLGIGIRPTGQKSPSRISSCLPYSFSPLREENSWPGSGLRMICGTPSKDVVSQRPRLPRGNRPPIDNRIILAAILLVLLTGIAWADRPRRVTADKGYDSGAVRAILRCLGVEPRIARRREKGFGAGRWSIERTLSWLKLISAIALTLGPPVGDLRGVFVYGVYSHCLALCGDVGCVPRV